MKRRITVACIALVLCLGAAAAQQNVDKRPLNLVLEDAGFNLWGQLLARANLTDAINPKARATLLAPDNRAVKNFLRRMSGMNYTELLARPQLIGLMASYHIIPGVTITDSGKAYSTISTDEDDPSVVTTGDINSILEVWSSPTSGVVTFRDVQQRVGYVTDAAPVYSGAIAIWGISEVLMSGAYFGSVMDATIYYRPLTVFRELNARSASATGNAADPFEAIAATGEPTTHFVPVDAAWLGTVRAFATDPSPGKAQSDLTQLMDYMTLAGLSSIPTGFVQNKSIETTLRGHFMNARLGLTPGVNPFTGKRLALPSMVVIPEVGGVSKVVLSNVYAGKGIIHAVDNVFAPSGIPSLAKLAQVAQRAVISPAPTTAKPAEKPPAQTVARPPAKAAAQGPGKTAAQPPAKSAAQLPAKPAAQPPAKPAAQRPAKPAAQPPAKPAAQRPATLAAQPPATLAAQPPAKTAAQPPAKPAARPPAKAAMQPPAKTAAQPLAKLAAKPPPTPAMQPPAKTAAQPEAEASATAAAEPPAMPTAQPTELSKVQPQTNSASEPPKKPTAQAPLTAAQPSAKAEAEPPLKPTSQPTELPAAQPQPKSASEPPINLKATAETPGTVAVKPIKNLPAAEPAMQPAAKAAGPPVTRTAEPAGQSTAAAATAAAHSGMAGAAAVPDVAVAAAAEPEVAAAATAQPPAKTGRGLLAKMRLERIGNIALVEAAAWSGTNARDALARTAAPGVPAAYAARYGQQYARYAECLNCKAWGVTL